MWRHGSREGAVIQSHVEALFWRRCSDTISCGSIVLERCSVTISCGGIVLERCSDIISCGGIVLEKV